MIRSRRRPSVKQEPTVKLFTRLPVRLAFCLKDAVPQSAIEAGHIFLGFSKCGQFLLSYTQSSSDVNVAESFLSIKYNYRLHWWLFVPYRRAKKVAEAMLFSNQGAIGGLHISFCQWPGDWTKLMVYGYATNDFDGPSSSKPCYMTVTAVPSLDGCKDCVKVAESYEEDDVAEAWNSCVRLSCLIHGLTIHTTFDLVPPYPSFEPKVSLKRDNHILINAGNLLYSLHINLEKLGDGKEDEKMEPVISCLASSPPTASTSRGCVSRWSDLQVGSMEFTLAAPFSPPMCSPGSIAHYSATSDSETTDCESESGANCPRRPYIRNEERLEKVAEFVEKLSPSPPGKGLLMSQRRKGARGRLLSFQTDVPSTSSAVFHSFEDDSSIQKMAEKAYELTDDDFDDGVQEKLSTFRKKRLAEKTYEFKDEDSENDVPLPRLRSQQRAQDEDQEQREDANKTPEPPSVLRPIDDNQQRQDSSETDEQQTVCISDSDVSGLMVDTMPVPELLSPGGMMKKEDHALISPRSGQPPRFHAKFTRRFIELDDEMISVITDVEEDDFGLQSNGYHTALPLEVHGAGYQPLAMISNSKAEKLTGRCIKITQRSFDLEVFCHHMALKLCQAANKKYWFLNDYDVEVVDLDPETGDVILVAVVLVNATTVTKKVSQREKYSISSLHRHQYQASFKFSWNIDTAEIGVIDSDPLKEIGAFSEPSQVGGGIWHPAKNASLELQKRWASSLATTASGPNAVKCMTNDAVIRGNSLKTIVDSDHLVAIMQDEIG